jgi:DNA polymerase
MLDPIYVPGCGNPDAKLFICGEAPGQQEEMDREPFKGASGALVNECLDYAGIDRSLCYLTNVCKVRPPHNDIDKLDLIGKKIEDFLPQLYDEILEINPNCILAIGDVALKYITGFKGIKKYRGSILSCSKTGHKSIPTLHPASLLHGESKIASWKELQYIKHDFQRAVEQSSFPEIRLPERNLWVARNSLDVYRFLDAHAKNEHATLDVETIKTYAQCIGLAFDAGEACSIPLFIDTIPNHDLVHIWKQVCDFLRDTKKKIIAHNAKFDEKRCRQIGLKWHDCYFDTAMAWHVLFSEMPKKLEFIASYITDEPYYKDEGKEFNPKIHKIDRWFLYNAKDAAVTFEIFEKIYQDLKDSNLIEFFFDNIMPLHRLYSDIEDVGILIDKTVRKHLRDKYEDIRAGKQAKLISNISLMYQKDDTENLEIKELYKDFNVMSNGPNNQVAKLVFGYLKLPVRKNTSDETLKSLANNNCKDQRRKDILHGILEVRKVRKTIGTYIDAELSDDQRIRTQCNINGAESGRTSTGICKPPVSISNHGIALQTMTKHEDINLDAGGADLRSMFIADPGWSFIEPDLSQAEDRVVCVLAEDYDALKEYERRDFKYNKHGLKDDRHTKTAMLVCELGFDAITDFERQVGKKTRHAGNYDMKKHMHMLNLAKYAGIFISEWRAGKQLALFHENNPKIKSVFHADIQEALRDNDCLLVTPHERRRIFLNKWGDELFKEAYAHIPQATISDQVKFAMLRIKQRIWEIAKNSFYFLLESHDSFLALIRDDIIDQAKPIIREELERPIDFRKCTLARDYDLVIPCEIKLGKRWIDASNEFQDGMRKTE